MIGEGLYLILMCLVVHLVQWSLIFQHFFKLYPGSDLVSWLHNHVVGLSDRRDARKYAAVMLQIGLIRHTVNKHSFSEQCYYVFGDIGEDTGKELLCSGKHNFINNLATFMRYKLLCYIYLFHMLKNGGYTGTKKL